MSKMIPFVLIIALPVLLAELLLRPRLDKTRDGKVLMWYGRHTRRYIVLKD